jgi:hypothetical protein
MREAATFGVNITTLHVHCPPADTATLLTILYMIKSPLMALLLQTLPGTPRLHFYHSKHSIPTVYHSSFRGHGGSIQATYPPLHPPLSGQQWLVVGSVGSKRSGGVVGWQAGGRQRVKWGVLAWHNPLRYPSIQPDLSLFCPFRDYSTEAFVMLNSTFDFLLFKFSPILVPLSGLIYPWEGCPWVAVWAMVAYLLTVRSR